GRPAWRAFHHDVEGRQHNRRFDGHRGHTHLDRAAVRRAAREFGEKIRVSAVRTERVYKKFRHSSRNEHHRLRVPLARVPVYPRLQGSDRAESRAARSTAERNSRYREEST